MLVAIYTCPCAVRPPATSVGAFCIGGKPDESNYPTQRSQHSPQPQPDRSRRASYDRYTRGLPSRAEQQLDPDLRLASSIGDGDEAEASYRLAVAQQLVEESEESCD